MANLRLDYDRIAENYNQRYPASQTWERGQALLEFAAPFKDGLFLEIGSGTGYWLNVVRQLTPHLFGLDYSLGMLRQAQKRSAPLALAQGSALSLPYPHNVFDFVYVVDAIHHFGDHRAFLAEAYRILKPGGALAVVGHDPHEGTTRWYIYDYFDRVYDNDLKRYPASQALQQWMTTLGFTRIEARVAERILNMHVGQAVLQDPFLRQDASSQLALLSEAEYAVGMERIRGALAEADARQEQAVFRADILVKLIAGYKPKA